MRGWILLIFVLLLSSVNALVLTVTEGELVKIKLKAFDPEGNPLIYTFTPPLNNIGEWQTQIGDAGMYPIIVTVSDGQSITEEEFILIVEEKQEEIPPIPPPPPPIEEIIEEEIEEEITEIPPTPPPPPPIEEIEQILEEEIIEEVEEVEEPPTEWKEEIFEEEINNPPKLEEIKDVEVTEGELVKITPKAYDEDNDVISYSFAYPLNENGEWQTKSGDYGEYIVTATATDGISIDSKTFKIIVNKKEKREINFEEIDDVTLNENEEINIKLKAEIEEGTIEFFAENMPEGATLSGNTFHFKPGQNYVGRNFFIKVLNKIYAYVPKKSKTVTFISKSEDTEEKQNVKIIVKDVNRLPKLEINDVTVNEGELVIFSPVISDDDGDWLKISYEGMENNYQTNFDDAGEYKIKATLADSFHSVSKEFNVVVKNVNREPVLEELPFSKINENEELKIKLIGYDPDDDKLNYYIAEGPGSINGDIFSWTPGYDFVKKNEPDLISKIKYFNKKLKQNNKEIIIKIGVNDGNLTDEKSFKVVVFDINQKPEIINFEPEDSIIIAKGGRIVFFCDVNDPDEDKLMYKWNFGFMDSLEGENKIARTFTRKGLKKIKVTVSDGVDSIEKIWKVKVI